MRKQRVLIVDDMKEVYDIITSYLKENYGLDYANSVPQGKTKIRDKKYDLVITDFEIGENHPKGGLEIIATANDEGIPVLGMSMENHKQEVLDANAKGFLFKKELYRILESDRNLNNVIL